MFEDLRQAFREAVDNFKKELNRDRVPERASRLLSGMRDEVTDLKAYLDRLEGDLHSTLERAEAEREEAETCRRRERMAREIGDDGTADVASEFAEKHEKRQQVLERKALALKEELDLRRTEVEEMMTRIKEARAQEDGLGAQAGRAQARDTLSGADDLFDEMDRMAEKILDEERRSEAGREMGDGGGTSGAAPDPEELAESRLRELKKRMGQE